MRDSFTTAINTQKATNDWLDLIRMNMSNIYTPGYRESQGNFKTFLDGVILEDINVKTGQGKAFPGTSSENVYLEGKGFFSLKNSKGQISYTRLGEFKFDGEGVYKSRDGQVVQGYILNDNGEILAGRKKQYDDPYTAENIDGGPALAPTTEIKLWRDPANGKYLGKYDEYEIKGDGVIYGKAKKGKIKVPLYKIAITNFNNASALTQVKPGQFIENEESGKPVVGKGDIRPGLIEMSNTNFGDHKILYKQAKMQLELTNKLVGDSKKLLEEAMRLLG